MSDERPTEYGLVEPFVVCRSKGGPYDDEAFVAGVQWARAEADLERLTGIALVGAGTSVEGYFSAALVPQFDLTAMRYGWRIEVEPWPEAPDEWALIRFIRSEGGS